MYAFENSHIHTFKCVTYLICVVMSARINRHYSVFLLSTCAHSIDSESFRFFQLFKKMDFTNRKSNMATRQIIQTTNRRSFRIRLNRSAARKVIDPIPSDDDQSVSPRRIDTRARKSFAIPLNQNVAAQLDAIQSKAKATQQQIMPRNGINDAVSALKTIFENNMNVFVKDLEKINKRYAENAAELKAKYDSKLAELECQRVRSVEEAKKKVFSNISH